MDGFPCHSLFFPNSSNRLHRRLPVSIPSAIPCRPVRQKLELNSPVRAVRLEMATGCWITRPRYCARSRTYIVWTVHIHSLREPIAKCLSRRSPYPVASSEILTCRDLCSPPSLLGTSRKFFFLILHRLSLKHLVPLSHGFV